MYVVSEKNLADFDSRLAGEGLLIPGLPESVCIPRSCFVGFPMTVGSGGTWVEPILRP